MTVVRISCPHILDPQLNVAIVKQQRLPGATARVSS